MQSNNLSPDLLDQALNGRSDTQKARVLELVVKMGVSPNDEFWLIFVAIGQLQVLIEDSPTDWQQLFTNFQSELSQWTDSNLQTLDTLAAQARNTTDLTLTLQQLSSTLNTLVQVSMPASTSSSSWETRWATLQKTLSALQTTLASIQKGVAASQRQRRSTVRSSVPKRSKKSTWSVSLMVLWFVVTFSGLWSLHQGQRRNAQILDWLLEKGNRAECLQGIKPKTSPECFPYLR